MPDLISTSVPGEDGVLETRRAGTKEGSLFLSALSWRDLQRLRQVVRRVHMRHYPAEFCGDAECDRVIETIAPSTAERLLKRLVDGKALRERDL